MSNFCKTPFEQRSSTATDQIFSLTNTNTADDIGTYIKHDQVSQINTNAQCNYQAKSSQVSWYVI